jgi:outer membrane protein assembly factor BamD
MKTSSRPLLAQVALALVVAAAAFGAAACASKDGKLPTGTAQPDKWLFERGTASLQTKKWFKAREYFRQLIDSYPQSPHRPDAKLGLADAYLGEGTAEALVYAQSEFREFLTFYPTSPRADYAQLRLAMAHFKQMPKPERDQTPTREAIVEFQALLDRYPTSSYRAEASARLRDARDRLGLSEYGVGLFYYRARWYPGAIDRFLILLKSDPEFTQSDAVYYHLAESLAKIDRKVEALIYFDRLVTAYPKSRYAARGAARIEVLKKELAAAAAAPPAKPKKF